jgi:hypothetical protein
MKNKIEHLRDHLFATLEALQDEDKPMDLDRAKTIADVAQTIINSAKVEVDFIKATGQASATDFIPHEDRKRLSGPRGV